MFLSAVLHVIVIACFCQFVGRVAYRSSSSGTCLFTGLNVFGMLKHESVVLTMAALNRIEERILFHKNKSGRLQIKHTLP